MNPSSQNSRPTPTPADLRSMFGANLRQLCANAPSIAGLCRELGINRTQFNRYLSGESFPRPDVLHRICSFFEVDARILLEPVSELEQQGADILNHPEIRDFIGTGASDITDDIFPLGFYGFYRPSFLHKDQFIRGLVLVYRKDGHTFIRGLEPKAAMREQGLPMDARTREFRGFLLPQEGGVAALITRRGSMTCSFNFLSRIPSFQNNIWSGYVTRTVVESTNSQRAVRMVYEHLGTNTRAVLNTARMSGFCSADELLPFHRSLLNPDETFK